MATGNKGKPLPSRKPLAEVQGILPQYKERGITTKEAKFAAEFLTNGLDGPKAYKDALGRANEGERACKKRAAELMKCPGVQEAIKLHGELWLRGRQESLEQDILKVLNARAFYDPALLINPDGTPRFKEWDELPEDFRRCIDGIETKIVRVGKPARPAIPAANGLPAIPAKAAEPAITEIKVKLANRMESLGMLAQYIHLAKGRVQDVNLAIAPETQALLVSIFHGNAPGLAGQPEPRALAKARRDGLKAQQSNRVENPRGMADDEER